jgi:hypothetical protein
VNSTLDTLNFTTPFEPRTVNLLTKKKTGDVARGASIFAGDSPARINALRRVVGAAMLSGIALSPNLWFPLTRSFPRASLIVAVARSLTCRRIQSRACTGRSRAKSVN